MLRSSADNARPVKRHLLNHFQHFDLHHAYARQLRFTMYSIAGRTALRTARPSVLRYTRPRFAHSATAEDKEASTDALKKGAKRDPELYVRSSELQSAFGILI